LTENTGEKNALPLYHSHKQAGQRNYKTFYENINSNFGKTLAIPCFEKRRAKGEALSPARLWTHFGLFISKKFAIQRIISEIINY